MYSTVMNSTDAFLKAAEKIAGAGGLLVSPQELEPYAHDEFATDEFSRTPIAVVKPATTQQVREIVALCAETGTPVTARGAGTGLSAGCVPSEGGIILSLERLNGVVEVDATNQTITLEAGATLAKLYEAVEEAGLFFPPHPGDEGATVGGAAAANAGGARAVKYGTVKQFVRGLEVVTADGRLVKLGGKAMKSSTGYHLMDLMIGSEGTLGIITGVTLSLMAPPPATLTLVVPYETAVSAIESVPPLLNAGIIPIAVEFVEQYTLKFAEKLLQMSWPARQGNASLIIMLDGQGDEELLAVAEKISGILEEHGALDLLVAEDRERQAEILKIRSMIYEALRPGTAELFDVCVPRSEIARHIGFVKELEEREGIQLPTYAHAADGNTHTHALRRSVNDGVFGDELAHWQEHHELARRELYADAIRRGGFISGEHGVGLVKRPFIKANLGEDVISMMAAVKKALDPRGILNPGKVLP